MRKKISKYIYCNYINWATKWRKVKWAKDVIRMWQMGNAYKTTLREETIWET